MIRRPRPPGSPRQTGLYSAFFSPPRRFPAQNPQKSAIPARRPRTNGEVLCIFSQTATIKRPREWGSKAAAQAAGCLTCVMECHGPSCLSVSGQPRAAGPDCCPCNRFAPPNPPPLGISLRNAAQRAARISILAAPTPRRGDPGTRACPELVEGADPKVLCLWLWSPDRRSAPSGEAKRGGWRACALFAEESQGEGDSSGALGGCAAMSCFVMIGRDQPSASPQPVIPTGAAHRAVKRRNLGAISWILLSGSSRDSSTRFARSE